jgi:hypothetical protein
MCVCTHYYMQDTTCTVHMRVCTHRIICRTQHALYTCVYALTVLYAGHNMHKDLYKLHSERRCTSACTQSRHVADTFTHIHYFHLRNNMRHQSYNVTCCKYCRTMMIISTSTCKVLVYCSQSQSNSQNPLRCMCNSLHIVISVNIMHEAPLIACSAACTLRQTYAFFAHCNNYTPRALKRLMHNNITKTVCE